MEHDHTVVQKNPTGLVSTLDSTLGNTLYFKGLLHLAGDVFGLNASRGACDHEVIANSGHISNIQDQNVVGLHFVGRLGCYFCYL